MSPDQDRQSYAAHIREIAPDHADWLTSLLKPAIWIEPTPAPADSIPIGASKFGGGPDLPAGFEWPIGNDGHLHLVAQFNLEELAPLDVEKRLPPRGLLSFFISPSDWTAETVPFVYWFPEGPFSRPEAPAGYVLETVEKPRPTSFLGKLKQIVTTKANPMAPPVPSRQLKFSARWQLPFWEDPEVLTRLDEGANGSQELPDELWISELEEKPSFHVFGHDQSVQGSARIEAMGNRDYEKAKSESLNWILLFQHDSADGWNWGDAGTIYYFIRREDLAANRFDRVRLVAQCT